jgi:HAD superfamily hydrolase (TIGR01549 family)
MRDQSRTHLVFDLDGTLIDSKPSIVYGIQELQRSLALPVSDTAAIRSLIGIPLPDMFLTLGIGGRDYEDLRRVYANAMFEHMHRFMKAFEGVHDVLHHLREQQVPLSIVTSRGRDSYEPCLRIAGIDPSIFVASICRDDCLNHKPHPEPLQKLASILHASIDAVIYVGDALVDVECAIAAGAKAVFATYDADHELPEHLSSQVLGVVSSFDQLLSLKAPIENRSAQQY